MVPGTNEAGLSTNASRLTVKRDASRPRSTSRPDRNPRTITPGTTMPLRLHFNPATIPTSGIAELHDSCSVLRAGQHARIGYPLPAWTMRPIHGNDTGPQGSGVLNFKYAAHSPGDHFRRTKSCTGSQYLVQPSVVMVFTGTDATSGIDTCSTINYSGPDASDRFGDGPLYGQGGQYELARCLRAHVQV